MILCCGEALIDMLPRLTADGEGAFAPHPGGAVFNTAVALGRLDAPVGFLSGLSTDFFGDQLRASLETSRVATDHVVFSDRPTTLAFVRLVHGQASYAFYDENTAGRLLSPADLPRLAESVDALFFGGISLIAEPCGASYEALMSREAPRRLTMIDPNVRAGFVSDEHAYRERIARLLAMADIVKVSDEDLNWLEGPGEIDSMARGLLTCGPKLVIVTHGADGVTGYTAGYTVFVAAKPATVVDTVGAGDTFNAGFMARLQARGLLNKAALVSLAEQDTREALDFGASAAAITVSRAGANPPWRAELTP